MVCKPAALAARAGLFARKARRVASLVEEGEVGIGFLVGDTVVVLPEFSGFVGTLGATKSALGGVRTGENFGGLVVAESDDGPLLGDEGVRARCGYAGREVSSLGGECAIVLPYDVVLWDL